MHQSGDYTAQSILFGALLGSFPRISAGRSTASASLPSARWRNACRGRGSGRGTGIPGFRAVQPLPDREAKTAIINESEPNPARASAARYRRRMPCAGAGRAGAVPAGRDGAGAIGRDGALAQALPVGSG
ncbi:hypothetical protein CT19431_120134 [Cupriavidus taiwanensis]|nr:hypothetical protein CT19431_120134 [Cupriavidus taiwanensis]